LSDAVEVLTSPLLAGLPHGFLGRRGGLSQGIHAGLNVGLGSADDRAAVIANRERASAAVLPGAALVTLHQVHSAEVVTVAAPWPDDQRPPADAMVTERPGLLLGILTADCAPVLLADAAAGVIGAAHAGWKGAQGGVLEATVDAMVRLGAERARIVAAIGPCIAQGSYEVDAVFEGRFVAQDPMNARFFREGRPGHAWFDLAGYAQARLEAAGIGAVASLGEDTCAQAGRFFSYRRATTLGEPDYGRQISLIGLPPG
jgi:YfiH family protein